MAESTRKVIFDVIFNLKCMTARLTVYGIFLVEAAQTAMTAADLCFWYVWRLDLGCTLTDESILSRFSSGYGNMNHLGNVNIFPLDTPIMGGVIAAIVQCFFAHRIFTLRRSYLCICILIILVRSIHHIYYISCRYLTILTIDIYNASCWGLWDRYSG